MASSANSMWKVLTGCVLAICAGLLLCAQNAQSQYNSFPPGVFGAGLGAPGGGVVTYTGPGDCSGCAFNATAQTWWGLRCYSNAYSGNVADVTDVATGSTTGTRLKCSSGVVSALVSGSACTFVTGNACSALATTCAVACNVVTLYDQSGKNLCGASVPCDITQATNANRPVLTLNCIGSLSCMTFVPATTITNAGLSAGATAQPYFISAVFDRTTSVAYTCLVCDNIGNQLLNDGSANGITMYVGGGLPVATAADNAFHAVQAIFDNAGSGSFGGSYAYIDGSATAMALAGGTGFGAGAFGLGNISRNSMTGKITEAGISAVAQSTTQSSSLNSNQHTYWGF